MLRLILSGCHGRMGRQVVLSCEMHTDVCVVAGIDPSARPDRRFPVFSLPRQVCCPADVLIDFSRPDALDPLLSFCSARGLPAVLAVTGYTPEQLEHMKNMSEQFPIFYAPNLSVGAAVLHALTRQAAQALGQKFGSVITERHHERKLDSPSGTALSLAKEVPWPSQLVSIRAGTTAGEHTVMFAGPDEVLELSHRADSREVYAAGALRAAKFLSTVGSPGLYSMKDIIQQKNAAVQW